MHRLAPFDVPSSRINLRAKGLGVLVFLVTLLVCHSGMAQIKRPGAHVRYSVELEPHGVIQWDGPGGFDEGIGAGFRASIPLFHNGPIPKINNNMAISFGFDWAYFDDPCGRYYYGNVVLLGSPDCSAHDLWFPVVLQWNFYLTPGIAVFGEPGFAASHTSVSFDNCPDDVLDCEESDTDLLNFVFYAGGKFFVSDAISVTVRLGFPSISVGASFYL